MNLRACSRALPRVGTVCRSGRSFAQQTRLGSSQSHHDSHADTETYPPEGFNFAFWRRTVLVVGGAFAFYNFAPSAASAEEKVNALTQYLTISREEGKRATDTHLALAKADADARILTDGATKPPVIRLRNPTVFENASPHCLGVGQQADLSDLRIKTDGQ
ncbi:hypothetical protein RhiXN_06352 [Rhizoctonia solani]|uniref:Uncharacterized protein n=1 Tax=Rhizoctonia solani TaxID=456999 RepID=A0A8H8NYS1_9AGAM|nr:uncharacterized protein RhiXN_06352 [Rhizoctonia solani]QRW21363.1 hypothetical protein RhiXN_06352 [Rhizoctonia solani]